MFKITAFTKDGNGLNLIDFDALRPELQNQGFIVNYSRQSGWSLRRGSWHIWRCRNGWQSAVLNPKTRSYGDHQICLGYVEGFEEAVDRVLNAEQELTPSSALKEVS